MAGSYINNLTEKTALVEADAVVVGDSTVTGAGSGKRHSPKQSATASSLALRDAGGRLKAADGVADDDLVTLLQRTQLNQQITRAMKAYNEDDSSLNLMYARQGYVEGDETKQFSPLHTFTRNSVKNVFNQRGVLEQVAANVPAFAYDPATGAPLGLSIEEQRTNLLLWSEDFTNAAWTKDGSGTGVAPVVTSNSTIAPNGNLTADTIIFDSGTGTTSSDFSRLIQTVAFTDNTIATNSVWIKGDIGGEQILIRGVRGVGYTLLTLTTEWQRVDISEDSGTSTDSFELNIRQGISGIGTINSSVTIHLWGAQLEQGSFPTSYIKTEGSQVTRAADVCTVDDLTPWFNPNEGTLTVTAKAKIGDVIVKAGALEIISDSDTMKQYTASYTTGQAATQLQVMPSANGSVSALSYKEIA